MFRSKIQNSQDSANRDFTVAFISTNDLSQEELEEEEDDDDDDDYDFNPNSLSSKLPRKRNVEMRIIETNQVALVKCRLAWTFSWLQASIRLIYPPTKRFNALQQLINGTFQVLEYHLDPSTGPQGRAAINKFFTDVCSSREKSEDVNGGNDRRAGADIMRHERDQLAAFLNRQPPHDCYIGKISRISNRIESWYETWTIWLYLKHLVCNTVF